MLKLQGKYNTAKVFTDNVEPSAMGQIIELCNQEFAKDSVIRIMPDVHSGAGCTIGTTMTLTDKVVPNLVGVDIGCGVRVVRLKEKKVELPKLDSVIRKCIPSGFSIREKEHKYTKNLRLEELHCKNHTNLDKAYLSLGSLGGGNHFIELAKSDNQDLYLLVHSGSRHLGIEVCKYYQDTAHKRLNEDKYMLKSAYIINELINQGRELEIEGALKKLKEEYKQNKVPHAFAYCEGELFDNYIHDMQIVQEFAAWNRKAITDTILKEMKLHEEESFDTIHNYIEIQTVVLDVLGYKPTHTLRKGAVSAKKNETLIIPINMRDGSLICKGKGNPDWNYSAPHGAGRLLSRSEAKSQITLHDFKTTMQEAGIFSTSVNQGTIDESPMAYKPIDEIMSNIGDTVKIVDQIKPIYNFKIN